MNGFGLAAELRDRLGWIVCGGSILNQIMSATLTLKYGKALEDWYGPVVVSKPAGQFSLGGFAYLPCYCLLRKGSQSARCQRH